MKKTIEKKALEFQELDRKIKDLQAKQKPLKADLINYAKEHKNEFDDAFQLKFANGTYVSQRIKDVVDGSNEAKEQFLKETDEFHKIQIDEAKLIEEFPKNNRLKKLFTKFKLQIKQKETLAIYAG